MSNQTAAILVGGKGTRLSSIVSDVPKPLAPIANEPFLYLILRQLSDAGITRVILLTGYLHDQIVAACGNGKQFGIEIIYSQEKEPLGTAGALALAKNHLAEDFILMNGDTYFNANLKDFFHEKLTTLGLIATIHSTETRFSHIEIDEEKNIINFLASNLSGQKTLVNAGIYRLSKKIFNHIPQQTHCSLEKDIFPKLVNRQLKSYVLPGNFIDIGIPESYQAFNQVMQKKDKE